MRPTGRAAGVVVLGAILYLAGGDYEVPWLTLLALLLWVLLPSAWLYARLNRRRLEAVASLDWAEPLFEGDRPVLRIALRSTRGEWGPARITGAVAVAAGRVTQQGETFEVALGPVRRGPVSAGDLQLETADPLGLFRSRRPVPRAETLALPRYHELQIHPGGAQEQAMLAAPRVGVGEEVIGVREYRHGDPLRRIHWRSSARRAELVVREYEPPAAPSIAVLCASNPADLDEADEIARRAASEVWTALRHGGRAFLGGPGLPTTRPDQSANVRALLEWLALYPQPTDELGDLLPRVGEVVAVGPVGDEMREMLEHLRMRGARVRE